MGDWLSTLLQTPKTQVRADRVTDYFDGVEKAAGEVSLPIERAIVAGVFADRAGFAFAAGYQAALHALLPALPRNEIVSFSVTEEGGNHPRAIQSKLVACSSERFLLSGKKRWATLAPVASSLLVVAVAGEAASKKQFRLVRVRRSAPGVVLSEMPPTPFAPEVSHAALSLTDVEVGVSDVFEGDGYDAYVKPFRTLEDIHVHGAILGYVTGVARRHGFKEATIEQLVAALLSVSSVAALDPSRPEAHVAVAGVLAQNTRLLLELEPEWASVGDAERERWHRDRNIFGIAAQVREKRRQRAWQLLREDEKETSHEAPDDPRDR